MMLFRVAFGIAVLFVLSLFLDWTFLANLSAWQYAGTGAVIIALVVSVLLEAERLRVLCQKRMSRGELMRILMIGYFVTNFTPSAFGGDGYKVYALGRRLGYSQATALVLLERALGFLVLTSVAALTMTWFGGSWVADVLGLLGRLELDTTWSASRAWLALVVLLLLAAALWRWGERVQRFLRRFVGTLVTLPVSAAVQFIGVTVCLHFVRSCLLCALLAIYGFSINVGQAWVAITAAALASLLPLSPGGLGIREAGMVAGLTLFGVDSPVALLAALVIRLANIVQAALGALLVTGRRGREANQGREQDEALSKDSVPRPVDEQGL